MSKSCSFKFQPEQSSGSTLNQSWDCPHEAVSDTDRCYFHLTPAEREAHGITDETISERLLDLLEKEGQSSKRIIGAEFGNLDFANKIIDSSDNHPIDLRHATVHGTVDFSNCEIHQPLDFRDAEFEALNWTEAVLASDLDLAGSVCHGDVQAKAIRVNGDCDARGTEFEGATIIDEARFHGDTCFRNVRFHAQTQFRGAEFQGDANLLDDDACFEEAVFEEGVEFTQATFRYADFVATKFGGAATFTEATFENDAEFRRARFADTADFRGVEFHGNANVRVDDADFANVQFAEDALFESSQFRKAVFTSATFEGRAVFADTIFDGEANFPDTTFERTVNLNETRFYDDTSFEDATFSQDVSVRGAEFYGGDNADDEDLTFKEATFGGSFDAEHAEFSYATFESATFDSLAKFGETTFAEECVFTDAQFEDEALFGDVYFGSDTSFADCTFDARARFSGAEFEGGDYVDDDDVSFESSTFEGPADFCSCRFQYANFNGVEAEGPVDFTDARFALDATFSKSRWNDETTFSEVRFQEDVNFESASFVGKAVFRGTEFHGGANTEEDDLTLQGAMFEGGADFYSARFRYVNLKDATFLRLAQFAETVFEDDADFSNCAFDGDVVFDEARFDEDVSFEDSSFEGECKFRGVEFRGGANLLKDDVTFEKAIFHSDVDFTRGEFGYADFSNATFNGNACFNSALFSNETTFTEAKIAGTADFERVTFDGGVIYHGAAFEGVSIFDQVTFNAAAEFADCLFRGKAEFTGAAFEGDLTERIDDANFRDAKFCSPALFDRGVFRYANFVGVTFEDDVSFNKILFNEGGKYNQIDVYGDFSMRHSRFEGRVEIHDSEFYSSATFRGTAFEGETDAENRAVNFDDTVFFHEATFDACEFRTASFEKTRFGADPSFSRASFAGTLSLQAIPEAENILVDMTEAELNAGKIKQPSDGAAFFDMYGTTVRDIELESNESEFGLLDYFRFVKTDFDGFDFSEYMHELGRNNWKIHTFRHNQIVGDDAGDGKANPDSATLEQTYLMAKTSADEFGHRKASSEFYLKEFIHRGRKNKAIFFNSNGSADINKAGSRNRLLAGGKWFSNLLLYETCGYGERLWRILYISGAVIVTWAVLYLTVAEGIVGPNGRIDTGFTSFGEIFTIETIEAFIDTLYFSLVTFTTLGYGDVQPIGPTARILASVESYVGALLIALVVFVIGRRMG